MELKENTYEEVFPLFENAYYGKPYMTRDGRKAIYDVYDKAIDLNDYHYLMVEGEPCLIAYNNDGIAVNRNKSNLDIIPEWTIDEEELDKLALDSVKHSLFSNPANKEFTAYLCGFKACYRKVMEGIV